MKISMQKIAALAVLTAVMQVTVAHATIVEPFTGGQLSAPGWSQGVGADASLYVPAAPDGSYGIALSEGAWAYNATIHFAPGEILSAWINPGPSPSDSNYAQGGRLYLGFGASNTDNAFSIVAASDSNQLLFQNNANASFNDLTSAAQSYGDQWYKLTLAWNTDGTATANLFDSDGTTLLQSVTETGLLSTNTGIALRGIGGAVVTSIDVAPVPLPAAAWLFGSSLIGLGFTAKRKLQTI